MEASGATSIAHERATLAGRLGLQSVVTTTNCVGDVYRPLFATGATARDDYASLFVHADDVEVFAVSGAAGRWQGVEVDHERAV